MTDTVVEEIEFTPDHKDFNLGYDMGVDALEHHIGNGRNRTVSGEGGDPYQAMVEAFGRAVRGLETWLRPADESVLLLELLDRIANERVVA